MTVALKNEIRTLARESVREAIRAELMNLRGSLFPLVSKSEEKDIVKRYGKPDRHVARVLRSRIS